MDPMSWWYHPYRTFNPPSIHQLLHLQTPNPLTHHGVPWRGRHGRHGRSWWPWRFGAWLEWQGQPLSFPSSDSTDWWTSLQPSWTDPRYFEHDNLFAWSLKKSMDQKFETASLLDGLKNGWVRCFRLLWTGGELVNLWVCNVYGD